MDSRLAGEHKQYVPNVAYCIWPHERGRMTDYRPRGVANMGGTIEKILSFGIEISRNRSRRENQSRWNDSVVAAAEYGIVASPRTLAQKDTFLTFLGLERRRAVRSGKSFVLMLLDVGALLENKAIDEMASQLAALISVSTRDTDVIGWYETGSIIGVVFTAISFEDRNKVSEALRTKIITALHGQLGPQLASKVISAIQVFPESLDREPSNSFAKQAASSEAYFHDTEVFSEDLPGHPVSSVIGPEPIP